MELWIMVLEVGTIRCFNFCYNGNYIWLNTENPKMLNLMNLENVTGKTTD